jgi:patatin-related protein
MNTNERNPEDPFHSQELRIALVMNGGVSLAVWIGGVTNEINRLIRGETLYGHLCDILHVRPRVDIVSGTSAGGINGAILALAMSQGKPLDLLRDIWLNKGDILTLLRPSTEESPSSLLNGDYFYKSMAEGFRAIRDQEGPGLLPASRVPIELFLTTTILRGEVRDFPDDAGTVIRDKTHRGLLRFWRGPDRTDDHFADPDLAQKLAAAARATASFPAAFDPFYLPGPEDRGRVAAGGEPVPVLEGHANFTLGCYVVDGGVLDNNPLEAAIEAVFRQRAEEEVRRVLAYVVPDPGYIPDPPSEDPAHVPTLVSTVLASLVDIPRLESVSEQLNAIRRHNQNVARRFNARILVARSLEGAGAEQVAEAVFVGYRLRRCQSAATHIAAALAEGAARYRDSTGRGIALGRRSRERIAAALADCAVAPWLPDRFSQAGERGEWWWGLHALENVMAVVLDLLRRAVSLVPARRTDVTDRMWPELMDLRRRAFDLVAALAALRARDRRHWEERGKVLAPRLADLDSIDRNALEELVRDEVRGWVRCFDDTPRQEEEAGPVRPPGVFAERARDIGGLMVAAAPLLHGVLALRLPARSLEAYADLATLAGFLLRSKRPTGPVEEELWKRMLALEVVHYAFGADTHRDQFMELFQFSANVPSAFGGPDRLEHKLAGVQVAHFGAFYKRSWRINDWMFGRLDGSERLLHILLDPKRLARLYGADGDEVPAMSPVETVLDLLRDALLAGLSRTDDRDYLAARWEERLGAMRAEFGYLERPDALIPEDLPTCAAMLRERVHLDILRRELPALADAVGDDELDGADQTGFGPKFLRRFRSALGQLADSSQAGRAGSGSPALSTEQLAELFRGARVGEEKLREEVGTDRFTVTTTRSAAVAVGALSGKSSGLRMLRGVFAAARTPLVVLDILVQALLKKGRVLVSLYAMAMAASFTVLIAPSAQWPGSVMYAAAFVLVVGFAVLLRRHPRLLWRLALLVVLVVVASLGWPLVQGWLT